MAKPLLLNMVNNNNLSESVYRYLLSQFPSLYKRN